VKNLKSQKKIKRHFLSEAVFYVEVLIFKKPYKEKKYAALYIKGQNFQKSSTPSFISKLNQLKKKALKKK